MSEEVNSSFKLREMQKLLDILDQCPRRERSGVGGQTIEASIAATRIYDVPASAVERAIMVMNGAIIEED